MFEKSVISYAIERQNGVYKDIFEAPKALWNLLPPKNLDILRFSENRYATHQIFHGETGPHQRFKLVVLVPLLAFATITYIGHRKLGPKQ